MSSANFVAVLRMSCDAADLERVLGLLGSFPVESCWRKGERRSAKLLHEDTGANLLVAEAANSGALVRTLLVRLEASRKAIGDAAVTLARMELDIGVNLDEGAWGRSLALEPHVLSTLSSYPLTRVVISVYA